MNVFQSHGYSIHEIATNQFVAQNDRLSITFIAEGRNGGTYTKVLQAYDTKTNRIYKAERYLYKHISVIQSIGYNLLMAGKLWDSVQDRPALEVRKETILQSNTERLSQGKKPLYSCNKDALVQNIERLGYTLGICSDAVELLNEENMEQLLETIEEDYADIVLTQGEKHLCVEICTVDDEKDICISPLSDYVVKYHLEPWQVKEKFSIDL